MSASDISQSPARDDRRTLVKRERERDVHTGWSKEVERRTKKRQKKQSDEQVGKYRRERKERSKRKEF